MAAAVTCAVARLASMLFVLITPRVALVVSIWIGNVSLEYA